MADDASRNPGPFDLRTVKALVALMSQHDLSEIDLREGMQRICLRRGSAQPVVAAVAAPSGPAPVHPLPKNDAPPPAAAKKLIDIKSPTPGTFYAAANPESQPFVKVGARVTPSTVVCLIEAMKLFNEVTAECTGTVTEILVENQQAVEYGQVLFRVDPTG